MTEAAGVTGGCMGHSYPRSNIGHALQVQKNQTGVNKEFFVSDLKHWKQINLNNGLQFACVCLTQIATSSSDDI